MKLQKCQRCNAPTAEGLPLCPECMRDAGAVEEEADAAAQLRDIARILSITAHSDANIQEAMTGILNIAARLERGK